MRLSRNTVWLVPLIFILTFPLWSVPIGKFLTPRGGFDPEIKKSTVQKRNFKLDVVKITQNQEGQRTAYIRADEGYTGENPDILIMENVDADIYGKNNEVTKIISKNGKYNTVTKILILTNDVIVHKTADNQFLYSDLLFYDSEKRTVHCPEDTRLKSDNAVIDGGSLDYDINTEKYVIGGRVHCVINGVITE